MIVRVQSSRDAVRVNDETMCQLKVHKQSSQIKFLPKLLFYVYCTRLKPQCYIRCSE